MKKSPLFPIFILCSIFLGFLLGLFIGRNYNHAPIQLSKLPNQATSETQLQEVTSAKININTATLDELVTLPGIGQTIAENILSYREANGHFTTVTELTMVKGISTGKLNDIIDYITVGGAYENSGS